MRTKINDKSVIASLVCLFGLLAQNAAGASAELSLDLNRFIKSQGLQSAKDVTKITTAINPGVDANWVHGYSGPLARSNFSLSAIDVSTSLNYGLKITASGSDVKAFQCAGRASENQCTGLTVEKRDGGLQFAAGSDKWRIDVYGNFCSVGSQCTVEFFSWKLRQIATADSIAVRRIPRVMVVIEHKDGISILDGERSGNLWLSLARKAKNSIDRLGNLVGAKIENSGLFELRFTNGNLILDLTADRALVADASGLMEVAGRLADVDSGELDNVIDKETQTRSGIANFGRLLASDGGRFLWENAFMAVSRQEDGSLTSQPVIHALPAPAMAGGLGEKDAFLSVTKTANGLNISHYDALSRMLIDIKKIPLTSSQNLKLGMYQGKIYRESDKGVSLLAEDGTEIAMSIDSNQKLSVTDTGSIFVQKNGGLANCYWEPKSFESKTEKSADSNESILSTPCGLLQDFQTSNEGTTASYATTNWKEIRILAIFAEQ